MTQAIGSTLPHPHSGGHKLAPHRRRRVWLRLAAAAFMLVSAVVLVLLLRSIEWPKVWTALGGIDRGTLLATAGLTLLAHLVYNSFDLLARRHVGHRLRTAEVMRIAFISYAFNLNLGAMIGGIGFRFRLYLQHGLKAAQVGRVIAFVMATNWLGYLALAGVVFVLGVLQFPPEQAWAAGPLRAAGVVMLLLAVAWQWLCVRRAGKDVRLRRFHFAVPTWRMGLAQFALGACSWMLMAAQVWNLLGGRVPYLEVLAVMLLACISVLVVRVPGGLGVIEGMFVLMLGHQVPQHELLAAVLAYRALHFLAPLMLAGALYAAVELRARRR